MKEQIYTIPVIDGFKAESECAFCTMYNKLEAETVDYMLGPSYMEDDIRMETDKIGFCPKHSHQMYQKQNRLGVALMLHTHLKKINSDISSFRPENSKKGFLWQSKAEKAGKTKMTAYIDNITNSCYICNRIDTTFERYIDTFFYMWKKKPEIKELFQNSGGLCIHHFSMLLSNAERLDMTDYTKFCSMAFDIEKKALKELEEDVEWFINKFDYKYADMPWKNSKDALVRALFKLSSIKEEE